MIGITHNQSLVAWPWPYHESLPPNATKTRLTRWQSCKGHRHGTYGLANLSGWLSARFFAKIVEPNWGNSNGLIGTESEVKLNQIDWNCCLSQGLPIKDPTNYRCFSSDKSQVHLLASLMTTSYDCSQLNFLEIPSRPGKRHNVTRLVVQICQELPINICKDQPHGTLPGFCGKVFLWDLPLNSSWLQIKPTNP